jgi:hypothetical protein
MRTGLKAGAFLLTAAALYAQPQREALIDARITNTASNRGKCTIDVVVDGVAEVEIQGLRGRLRTLSGQPATWRRLECNTALPVNPIGFEFKGQEGRGRQTLLRTPDQNRGVAVIRIEDTDGGREGYKFDLEWRGDEGGFGRGPGNGPGRGPDIGRGPDRGPDQGGNSYSERGDGYFRPSRGGEQRINRADVNISRGGQIEVILGNGNRNVVRLTGRIIYTDGNRQIADLAGDSIRGTMELLVDNRGRVRELAMTGVGRNRAEVYWESR